MFFIYNSPRWALPGEARRDYALDWLKNSFGRGAVAAAERNLNGNNIKIVRGKLCERAASHARAQLKYMHICHRHTRTRTQHTRLVGRVARNVEVLASIDNQLIC